MVGCWVTLVGNAAATTTGRRPGDVLCDRQQFFLYYEENKHPHAKRSPDDVIRLIKGRAGRARTRVLLHLKEKAGPPARSSRSPRNKTKDEDTRADKRNCIKRLGVPEYFLFDPYRRPTCRAG